MVTVEVKLRKYVGRGFNRGAKYLAFEYFETYEQAEARVARLRGHCYEARIVDDVPAT